ncbi:hypothetical protein D9615_009777 [Tricholomella constricta]|uniref:RRM domain-containing protein n=1 Tax=Tricholomella constricta TaxID=117010 RepID=A0A8H5LUF2_9AGAR|nr:hypothetical protein D9615_009777 [Tricholomella constricta]
MPPKKAKKIPLNEFLGNDALGSWADEMDSLPSAPAARNDDDPGDRYGRRDDFLSSRPDRLGPPRDDVPMPTSTSVHCVHRNLAFDLTESELEEFFGPSKTKSVKIIKDREDKPKGFGYIEFEELDGLKDALAKSGSNFSGRTVRVSVAEPPKERSGFGGGNGFDDEANSTTPGGATALFLTSANLAIPHAAVSMGLLPQSLVPLSPTSRPSGADPVSRPLKARPARRSSRSVDQRQQICAVCQPSEEKFGSMRAEGTWTSRDTALDEGDWRSARPKSNISPDSSTPPHHRWVGGSSSFSRGRAVRLSPDPIILPQNELHACRGLYKRTCKPLRSRTAVDVTNKDKESKSPRAEPPHGRSHAPTTGPPVLARQKLPAPPRPRIQAGVGAQCAATLSFASAAAAKRDAASAIAAASNEKAEPQDEKRAKAEADDVEKVVEKVAEVAI